MRERLKVLGAASAVLLSAVAAGPAAGQLAPIPQDRGSNGLGLALRRIGVTARVLYVTAHPDDEHNGMLVRLSRGLGVRTALLTLTRGDGGQNAIGPELFEALSVLRAEELAAVHRYDGAEQYFGLSSDFGYSFGVEETFAKWGREAALGDVVRILRSFRPDVVLTLPVQQTGGGQHHQAAGHLAREGFRAAADPIRFPELTAEGLLPWQARKLYWTGVGLAVDEGTESQALAVRTGVYDPLFGLTWQQVGSVARALHRSQGHSPLMSPSAGGEVAFVLLDSEPPVAGREGDVLDGLDLTFAGLLRFAPDHERTVPFLRGDLQALQARADAARAAFDPTAPERVMPSLQAVLAGVRVLVEKTRGSGLPAEARDELIARLVDEERDTEAALRLAHGLDVEVVADDGVVVPGQTFMVTTTVTNPGGAPIQIEDVTLAVTSGWSVLALDGSRPELGRGQRAIFRHQVRVPVGAVPSQPYWRRTPGSDRFALSDPQQAGRPWSPPDVVGWVRYRSDGVTATATQPAHVRYASPSGGEKQKIVAVGSELSVRLEPEVTVVAVGSRAPREFRVAVRNERKGSAAGSVRLDVPAGWSVEPRAAALRLRHEGEEMSARFSVTPGAMAPGQTSVRAVFVDESGREFAAGDQVIAYDHIHERRLVRPAAGRVVAVDVAVTPGVSVGYVEGSGDDVDGAIRQLGVPLTYLTADDLAFGDLSRFTTIVTGVRAYEARPDLRSFHHRLMRYVEGGGNLVVQYNRLDFNRAAEASGAAAADPTADSPYAPYPALVSSDRVTDENVAPRVLRAESVLLTTPNRITDADWQGWIQERGLHFLAVRDVRYEEIVAFTDPFPLNPGEKRGALVDAAVGRGRWTYVGLGLFRQLPAGVPGAYRLLANIVGRPRAK